METQQKALALFLVLSLAWSPLGGTAQSPVSTNPKISQALIAVKTQPSANTKNGVFPDRWQAIVIAARKEAIRMASLVFAMEKQVPKEQKKALKAQDAFSKNFTDKNFTDLKANLPSTVAGLFPRLGANLLTREFAKRVSDYLNNNDLEKKAGEYKASLAWSAEKAQSDLLDFQKYWVECKAYRDRVERMGRNDEDPNSAGAPPELVLHSSSIGAEGIPENPLTVLTALKNEGDFWTRFTTNVLSTGGSGKLQLVPEGEDAMELSISANIIKVPKTAKVFAQVSSKEDFMKVGFGMQMDSYAYGYLAHFWIPLNPRSDPLPKVMYYRIIITDYKDPKNPRDIFVTSAGKITFPPSS